MHTLHPDETWHLMHTLLDRRQCYGYSEGLGLMGTLQCWSGVGMQPDSFAHSEGIVCNWDSACQRYSLQLEQ